VIFKALTGGLQMLFYQIKKYFSGVESSSWRATNVFSTSEPEEQCVRIDLL
jgi:hypothetical protein